MTTFTLTSTIFPLLNLANTTRICFPRNSCVSEKNPCNLRNGTESASKASLENLNGSQRGAILITFFEIICVKPLFQEFDK